LAYMSRRGVDAIVVVQSLATGEVRELMPDPPLANSPEFRGLTWTPDGRSLVVFGSDLNGREGIYRIDAADGAVSPLIATTAGERPKFGGFSWSPGGDRLYFGRMNGEITEYDLARGGLRVVPQRAGSDSDGGPTRRIDVDVSRSLPGYKGSLRLSPDGRRLAYVTGQRSQEVWVLEGLQAAMGSVQHPDGAP